jgi:hypothetical protein
MNNDLMSLLLMALIPGAMILGAVKLLLDDRARGEQARLRAELRKAFHDKHMQIKLGAHERALLFLERISPEHLLPRLQPQGKAAAQFHAELVEAIRSEYEYNLSQQLYIRPAAWKALAQAKDAMIALAHESHKSLPEGSDAGALALRMLERYPAAGQEFIQKAINETKEEVLDLFRFSE